MPSFDSLLKKNRKSGVWSLGSGVRKRKRAFDSRLQTSDSRLQTPDSNLLAFAGPRLVLIVAVGDAFVDEAADDLRALGRRVCQVAADQMVLALARGPLRHRAFAAHRLIRVEEGHVLFERDAALHLYDLRNGGQRDDLAAGRALA